MSEINWIKQRDDYTAKVGEYVLEVFYLSERWWWAVSTYIPEFSLTDSACALTPEKAKKQAEQAYLEHIKK